MRVLVVHSFYSSRQASGENRAVERQVEALERAGYDVELAAQRTDERERSRAYPLAAAFTVATGIGPSVASRAARADVVHVNNLFPNFGRNWLKGLATPVVATVHNYRVACAAGTFFRDGRTCTLCFDTRSSRPALEHGCYRGSRLRTVPLAVSTGFDRDVLVRHADRIIVLNETARRVYAGLGVPADRLRMVPNFLPDSEDDGPSAGGDDWLYVGRLSPEKGLRQLLREWPDGMRLRICGSGPDEGALRALAGPGVEFLGPQPADVVRSLLREAVGLVFPSRWFEGAPLVYPEALAAGTPVLAWDPSSVAESIRSLGTGHVVEGDLSIALGRAAQSFPGLRGACRSAFEGLFTEKAWVGGIGEIYDGLGSALRD